jgi:DNA (cytosine-5)-methyltransferase 1
MEVLANSHFAGGGLMDTGLKLGGVNVANSYELDADACKVARANGHNVTQCDITQKLALDEPACDVRVFTYPCNHYAGIAAIHGTRTGDDLFLHALRHQAIHPTEAYVLENVPGMKKFPVVMEAMTKLPDYYVTVFCPVQSQTWLPQKRDRLIIFGTRRPFAWRPPESVRRVSLIDILEENPQPDYPDYIHKRMAGKYRDLPIISDPARGDLAPTCVAHYSKDLSTRLVKDGRFPNGVRPYTVREYARLQGLPDSYQLPCSSRTAYKIIGNGVSVPAGEWIGRELVRYFSAWKG